MIKCTAPIRGHRSPRAERDCPRCGNRPAETLRNSKSQYSHAERVKQLSNTSKLQYNSTQRAYVDYLTMEYVYKRTHIPLTITRNSGPLDQVFFTLEPLEQTTLNSPMYTTAEQQDLSIYSKTKWTHTSHLLGLRGQQTES